MELGNFPAELEIEDSLHNFTQTPNMLCTEFIERYPNFREAKTDFRIKNGKNIDKVCKVEKNYAGAQNLNGCNFFHRLM